MPINHSKPMSKERFAEATWLMHQGYEEYEQDCTEAGIENYFTVEGFLEYLIELQRDYEKWLQEMRKA